MRYSNAGLAKVILQFAAGLALSGAASETMADSIAYVGTGSGTFGSIDLDTGAFTELGSSGQLLAGMAVANGTLFASSYHVANGTLFSVNPASGSLTAIGSSTVSSDDLGSRTTGGIYAVGTDASLYAINPVSGSATLIGATGLALGPWRSLSTNTDTLYFANGASLYTLDTQTGASTLVGNMGGPQIGAMVFEDGVLCGGEETPSLSVVTLNPATGAATTAAPMTGSGSGAWWAIAPYPVPAAVVPEPPAAAMLLLGLAAVGMRSRRSKS